MVTIYSLILTFVRVFVAAATVSSSGQDQLSHLPGTFASSVWFQGKRESVGGVIGRATDSRKSWNGPMAD